MSETIAAEMQQPVAADNQLPSVGEVPALNLADKIDDRPITPDQQGGMSSSASSVSSSSSPATPRETSLNTSGLLDTLNESGNRDDLSSGSPSPTPEGGELEMKPKPKIQLGKDISLMMQALESLHSPEEKIAALCKKYADLLQQQKLLQKQLKTSQKKQTLIMKEKDRAQTEHSKVMLANSKLESLARELQKRNKVMKEEQTRKHNEEVVLRKEMASKFQSSLTHIESKMKLAIDGNTKLSSENESMHKRLNEMVQKYQQREKTLEQLVHQYNIEAQLSAAQYEKSLLECATEKEERKHEMKKLMEQIHERDQMLVIKSQQEVELQQQIRYYSEKFEDFQATLERSNEVFASFQEQIDKLSKQLKKAEKEKMVFQKKWEDATRGISETISYAQKIEGKQTRLEKLSRALQAERNELAQRLRQYEGDGKENKKGVKSNQKKKTYQPPVNNKKENKNSRSTTPTDLKKSPTPPPPPVSKSPLPAAEVIETPPATNVEKTEEKEEPKEIPDSPSSPVKEAPEAAAQVLDSPSSPVAVDSSLEAGVSGDIVVAAVENGIKEVDLNKGELPNDGESAPADGELPTSSPPPEAELSSLNELD